MDKTDEKILELIKGNARMSYQKLGDAIGMTRVAAKKRVQKLEREGVIRGYNTCIYRDQDITLLIDIVTAPGRFESVLKYVSTRTAYVRQIFCTTKQCLRAYKRFTSDYPEYDVDVKLCAFMTTEMKEAEQKYEAFKQGN